MSKKAADEEAAALKIKDYMLAANRPYSAIDVTTNLRKEFGKSLVVKCLESLVLSGHLKDKAFGKQKMFFANQVGEAKMFFTRLSSSEAWDCRTRFRPSTRRS